MNQFIHREKEHEILVSVEKEKITLITGARQIGKTTLMKSLQDILTHSGKKTFFLNLEDIDPTLL